MSPTMTPLRTIVGVMRGEVQLPPKQAQKIGRQAPDLLSLCTCDLDYTSHNATNSSRGSAGYQIRGQNRHRI